MSIAVTANNPKIVNGVTVRFDDSTLAVLSEGKNPREIVQPKSKVRVSNRVWV
jgi:hypothetical protein